MHRDASWTWRHLLRLSALGSERDYIFPYPFFTKSRLLCVSISQAHALFLGSECIANQSPGGGKLSANRSAGMARFIRIWAEKEANCEKERRKDTTAMADEKPKVRRLSKKEEIRRKTWHRVCEFISDYYYVVRPLEHVSHLAAL